MIYRYTGGNMTRFRHKAILHRLLFRRQMPSIKVLALVAIIAGSTVIAGFSINYSLNSLNQLRQFSSFLELVGFIQTSQPTGYYFGSGTLTANDEWSASATARGTSGYSTTNIQVQGVDEPDIVKTDGTYIYAVGEDAVSIIQAYPTETAQLVSTIYTMGKPLNLFLYDARYLVVTSRTGGYWVEIGEEDLNQTLMYLPESVAIEVFDVTDPIEIQRTFWMSLDGSFLGARLIENYLYFLSICSTEENETIVLPHFTVKDQDVVIPATAIYFDSGNRDFSFRYTLLIGFDITESDPEISSETILGGSSSATIYTSLYNVYLAISRYAVWTNPPQESNTAIHRFKISQGEIDYQVSGVVPGHLINQFSLDEFAGFLRVATESIVFSRRTIFDIVTSFTLPEFDQTQSSSVFVLDMQMNIVGSLRGLAPGEQIYSTRFVGTMCYLVTFFMTDPLFVIDLSLPAVPRLLGELIIPGYSDYLHPLGDKQLLGIGKDVAISSSEAWWWYQGLKLSLFNTSDPYTPVETTNLILGVRGTTSPALDNHKAVLVDTTRQFLVLPILLAEYIDNPTPEPWEHGDWVFQGAYVFDYDTDNAVIDIRGRITHIDNSSILDEYYWGRNPYFIERTLYINDTLFAISPYKLTFHALDTLEFQGEIILDAGLAS
jgi:uncharacterized secreted protein with C-terminal beta-propeller domain